MNRILTVLLITVTSVLSFMSCKNCAKCHAEVMGVSSPSQELCGEELEKAKETAGMVCE